MYGSCALVGCSGRPRSAARRPAGGAPEPGAVGGAPGPRGEGSQRPSSQASHLQRGMLSILPFRLLLSYYNHGASGDIPDLADSYSAVCNLMARVVFTILGRVHMWKSIAVAMARNIIIVKHKLISEWSRDSNLHISITSRFSGPHSNYTLSCIV